MRRTALTVALAGLMILGVPARADHPITSHTFTVRTSEPYKLVADPNWYTQIVVESSCSTLVSGSQAAVGECGPISISLRYNVESSDGGIITGSRSTTVGGWCRHAEVGCSVSIAIPSEALDWWVEASETECTYLLNLRSCRSHGARDPQQGAYPPPVRDDPIPGQAVLILEPATQRMPAYNGVTNTVSALLYDEYADPTSGVRIFFGITSGPHAGETGFCDPERQCVTDSSGRTAWFFHGNGQTGTDIIVGWVDSNPNGRRDEGEISDTAEVIWETPS